MAYKWVDSANGPYYSITAAINAANAGDIIVVEPGSYTESVIIDKQVSLRANTNDPVNNDVIITAPLIKEYLQ